MSEEAEKRRHRRYEVEGVNGSLTFAVDVKIVNLSLEGMAIETGRRLNVNTDYSVRLKQGDEHLELTGKIVWSTLTRTVKTPEGDIKPVYRAGIRFVDVLDEKSRSIISFIENNRIVTLEKRILGRFKINSGNALLKYPQDYIVKRLSLSGMLIETELPLEPEDQVEMSLRLPDNGELNFTGRVANVQPREGEGEFYRIGVEFLDLDQKNREILTNYLKQIE